MLNILPIRFVSEPDQAVFGAEAFKLSKLKRLGLGVGEGFVVEAPDFVFETVLKYFKTVKEEVFQQRLEILKKDLNRIVEPDQLKKDLSRYKHCLVGGAVVEKGRVWSKLKEIWVGEAATFIWNHGFESGINNFLTPVVVLGVDKGSDLIKAFWDEELKDVIVESSIKLSEKEIEYLKSFVKFANNKLFIPHKYLFVKGKKINLASLSEYTHKVVGSTKVEVQLPKKVIQFVARSAVKVFADASSGFENLSRLDGVIIRGEEIVVGCLGSSLENLIYKLQAAAVSAPKNPVIFRLPDIVDKENIRGSLRLIYQKSLLNECLEAFLFLKNKKGLFNINIGIPTTRDYEELVNLKQELAVKGVSRKGNLLFWLEVTVPENILNLNKYIEVGVDGVILNLDSIHAHLGGYHIDEGQYYRHQVSTLFSFLKPALMALHKLKIPFLATGSLVLHPEVLDFLVEMGVWGVVSNNVYEVNSLPEHLRLIEKRILNKKAVNL